MKRWTAVLDLSPTLGSNHFVEHMHRCNWLECLRLLNNWLICNLRCSSVCRYSCRGFQNHLSSLGQWRQRRLWVMGCMELECSQCTLHWVLNLILNYRLSLFRFGPADFHRCWVTLSWSHYLRSWRRGLYRCRLSLFSPCSAPSMGWAQLHLWVMFCYSKHRYLDTAQILCLICCLPLTFRPCCDRCLADWCASSESGWLRPDFCFSPIPESPDPCWTCDGCSPGYLTILLGLECKYRDPPFLSWHLMSCHPDLLWAFGYELQNSFLRFGVAEWQAPVSMNQIYFEQARSSEMFDSLFTMYFWFSFCFLTWSCSSSKQPEPSSNRYSSWRWFPSGLVCDKSTWNPCCSSGYPSDSTWTGSLLSLLAVSYFGSCLVVKASSPWACFRIHHLKHHAALWLVSRSHLLIILHLPLTAKPPACLMSWLNILAHGAQRSSPWTPS